LFKKIIISLKKKIYYYFYYKKVFYKCRKYLENGWYSYSNGEFYKCSFFSFKKKFLCLTKKKIYHYKSLKYSVGYFSKKELIFLQDKIINVLHNISNEKFSLFIKNIKKINYPVMSIFNIKYEDKSFESELINGEQLKVLNRNNRLIIKELEEKEYVKNVNLHFSLCELLLKLSLSAEKREEEWEFFEEKKKIITYLQHGDCKEDNVLIKNGNFIFIDMDTVDYLPALYDFSCLIFEMKDEGIKIFNSFVFDEYYRKLFKTQEIDYFKDYYFALGIYSKYTFLKRNFNGNKAILPNLNWMNKIKKNYVYSNKVKALFDEFANI